MTLTLITPKELPHRCRYIIRRAVGARRGAIIGYLLLRPFFNDTIFGVLFGAIAGIMMFISLEELLPMAREYEKSKITIISVVIGMAIIALSLLLFL